MPRWTEQEKETLFAMRAEGKTWGEIADAIERDHDACRTWYRDWQRRQVRDVKPRPKRGSQMFGPPKPPGCYLYTRAVNRLLDNMPASVVAELMGSTRPTIPGTERIYRGQMAEREFARPIGEIIRPIISRIMEGSQAA